MSGSNSKINISISASGNVAAQVAEITKQLDKLKTPAERANDAVSKFADSKRVSSLASSMMDVSRASFGAFMSISRMVAPLGAITSAASLAGLAKMTKEWSDAGVQLGTAAQRARIGTDQLARWQGAAYLAGSSAQALTAGVTSLNDNLTRAANGTNPEAIMSFAALRMSFRNADGSVKDVTKAFPELITALQHVRNPTLRAQYATALLGGAAEDLMPIINGGADAFARFTEQAGKAGSMTAHQVEVARDFQLAQRVLTLAVGGLANAIEERITPALTGLLQQMTSWIEGTDSAGRSNRDLIANDVAGWANAQLGAVKAIGGAINEAVTATIGWNHALEALEIALGARLLGKVTGLNVALKALGFGGSLGIGSAITAAILAAELAQGETAEKRRQRGGVGIFGSPFPTDRNAYGEPDQAAIYRAMRDLMLGMAGSIGTRVPGGARGSLPTTPLGQRPDGAGGGLWGWLHQHLGIGAQAAERPMAVQPGRQVGATSALPIGFRTNNPLNLQAGPGQDFQVAADGEHVGVFRSMQEGIAAEVRQLMRYQDVYKLNTVRDIVRKWVGHAAPAYVASVAKSIGVSPDQPIDLHQRSVLESYIRGAAPWESGRLNDKDISAGVAAGMLPPGAAPGGPASAIPSIAPSGPPVSIQGGSGRAPGQSSDATTVNGQASLLVRLAGFPQGTTTVARTDGDLFREGGPVRIEQIQVGKGMTA